MSLTPSRNCISANHMFFRGRIVLALAVCGTGAPKLGAAQPTRDSAIVRFYQGPVRLESVSGTINLVADAAPASLIVRVRNESSTPQSASVGFRGMPLQRVYLRASESSNAITLPVMRRTISGRGGVHSVAIDLRALIDGIPTANAVRNVDVRFLLPAGVATLMRSSLPLERADSAGLVGYRFTGHDLNPSQLTLVYTTNPVSLTIDRQLSPSQITRSGPVTITLVIRNVGLATGRGITLRDNFDPRDFRGEGAEFRLHSDRPNDRRLLWSRELEDIAPGETKVISFSIIALRPVHSVSLSAATAVLDQALVGISEKTMILERR